MSDKLVISTTGPLAEDLWYKKLMGSVTIVTTVLL